MKPYGLISDTHNHAWSAFSTVLETGVNSRLQMLLDETKRCAREVRKAGGDTIIHAGDLFHVRGSIAPSVLNPTMDCYRDLIKDGFRVIIDAGNHDLEGKDANRVSSAITALEGIGCRVINSTKQGMMVLDRVVLIPWIQDIAALKAEIENLRDVDTNPSELDLVIHAPIDGVIAGLPDHGLSETWLAGMGFRRVFAGHYHNHKVMAGGKVISIGALAHHTWGDIGTKAGFLVVNGDDVTWFKSHAPEFIEITEESDPDEIPLLADGNYVRAKVNSTEQSVVEELRAHLTNCGAKGVVIMAQKKASVEARSGSTVSAGASMEVSVNDFIKTQTYANPEKLALLCQSILTDARSAA